MNKVVLVTGSSRGIGKATIIEFAKKGYNVVINYLKSKKAALELKEYVQENFDVEALIVKADISNENQVKNMISCIINKFGRIDVLVNNAGIAIDTAFECKTVKDFKEILDVNLIGAFLVSREVGNYMLNNKYGAIINVSSNNAYEAYYEYSLDYDASKAALVNLTHNLSKHYAPNIRVNAVAPGWVNTDMNKTLDDKYVKDECSNIYLKRFADPSEIAKVIVFLAGDDASYINNTVIRVDGGSNHA